MADSYGQPNSTYGQAKPAYVSNKEIGGDNIGRVLPRQVSTGIMRGTQGVGTGGVQIDSSNNRIVIPAPDGTAVGMGSIPGSPTEYGFFSLDVDGKLSMKIVNGTMFVYDPQTSKNSFQAGLLPDGTGGAAGANEGFDVADGF
jgi:hypothetical protein